MRNKIGGIFIEKSIRTKGYRNIFIISLTKTIISGKTYFIFLLLFMSSLGIWGYSVQTEWYIEAHGVQANFDPRDQAISRILKVTAISGFIFIYFLIKEFAESIRNNITKRK